MVDVFSPAKRSEVMARIRGKGNRSTELVLVGGFRAAHVTGWRRHVALSIKIHGTAKSTVRGEEQVFKVRPDFIFRASRLAIFVDGCFWHCCPLHSKIPENNRSFWEPKLQKNVARDRKVSSLLRKAGWSVLRVWEHELADPEHVVKMVRRRLMWLARRA
jgi:DNA mismatch endonuclease (patch repair protein)